MLNAIADFSTTTTAAQTGEVALTIADLEAIMDTPAAWGIGEDTKRDARWCWRWVNGYTDKANQHARRNVVAAAKRLGLKGEVGK